MINHKFRYTLLVIVILGLSCGTMSINQDKNRPTITTPESSFIWTDEFETVREQFWPNDKEFVDGVQARYFEGKYELRFESPYWIIWTDPGSVSYGKNVRVAVDATPSQTSAIVQYGVMCRRQPNNQMYVLRITNDGQASIAILDANANGEAFTYLAYLETSDSILDGETNRLAAECIGDQLRLFVNDKLILETKDDTFGDGWSGLIAETFEIGDVTIFYDNFEFTRLQYQID